MKSKAIGRLFGFTAMLLSFSIFLAPNGNAEPITPLFITQDNVSNVSLNGLTSGQIYTLVENIDLTNVVLGDASSYFGHLDAIFDGNLKIISGLIKPLFNHIESEAQAKNVILEATNDGTFLVKDHDGTGVLAKSSEGTINRVSVSGLIDADGFDNVGGVVGVVAAGSVNATASSTTIVFGGDNVGGLVGLVEATVSKSTEIFDGVDVVDVALEGASISATISDSSASGSITGTINVGGLVGSAVTTIQNSVSVPGVVQGSVSAGGIIGAEATVEITNSSASGSVTGQENVGGLVGNATAMTSNSTAAGGVINGSLATQGITDSISSVKIIDSTASGDVSGSTSTGGIVGTVNAVATTSVNILGVIGSNVTSNGINGSSTAVSITNTEPTETPNVTGTVSGSLDNTGGLVGSANSAISVSTDVFGVVGTFNGGLTVNGVNSSSPVITISNQNVSSNVSGEEDTGGLIGSASANVSDSNAILGVVLGNVNITGTANSSPEVLVEEAVATGTVEGRNKAGGLIGLVESSAGVIEIIEASVTGQVIGIAQEVEPNLIPPENEFFEIAPSRSIGGLIGQVELNQKASLQIENAHTTGDVSGNVDVGGLIGIIYLTGSQAVISESSASGTVTGEPQSYWNCLNVGWGCGWNSESAEPDDIGGLIGDVDLDTTFITIDDCIPFGDEDCQDPIENSQLTINNSFSTSPTVSGYDSIGGLIGEISVLSYDTLGFAGSVTVAGSFSTSQVIGSGNSIGGLIGSINESGERPDTGEVSIQNSFATGSAQGRNSVGGLVGYGWNIEILDSYAHGNVSASNFDCNPDFYTCPDLAYFGGLVGYAYNIVLERSYAQGDVTGVDYVGGLIGETTTGFAFINQISTSHASGDVTGNNIVGGLIGAFEDPSILDDSYASGNVNGTGFAVGGLVGEALRFTLIQDSFALGDVSGNHLVGGLVGALSGTIFNSFALGDVDGINYTGGLAGSQTAGSGIYLAGAYGDVNTNNQCSEGPYGDEECRFIGGLVGFTNGEDEIDFIGEAEIYASFATGNVIGSVSVGGLVGEAYGRIESSWAEGNVIAAGGQGEPFVGFCGRIIDREQCEMGEPEESPWNLDPSEDPSLRIDIEQQLLLLDSGDTELADFGFRDCINGGLPYLLSLADSYVNICEDEDEDNGGGDEVNDPGQSEFDIASLPLFRFPPLTKTLIKEPISTRNFAASKVALPATCTFKLPQENAAYEKTGLSLASANIAESLSRISLKSEESLQLRLSTSGEKTWDVWVNDPVCGQVKIGTTTLKDGKDEIVLLPIQFVKTGDFIISFSKASSDSVELKFEDLEFRVVVKVNNDGLDEFLGAINGR